MSNDYKICNLCKGEGHIYTKVNPPRIIRKGWNYHTGEKIEIMVVCPIEGCRNGIIKPETICRG